MADLARLSCHRAKFTLDPPLSNARHTWSERETVLVDLDGGLSAGGRGEAAPLPGHSSDDLGGCERALLAIPEAALAALGRERHAEVLLEQAASLVSDQFPAARFALETAALDRLSRGLSRPLWSLLLELAHGRQNGLKAVPLCALLASADPEAALAEARRLILCGVHTFKLKIGPHRLLGEQAATIRALRAALGQEVALRLDANGSLSRSVWLATLQELAPYAPEFVEEPIANPEPAELARAACALALDESLQSLDQLARARLLAVPTCRVLVLKPTALGGFGRCLALAREARAAGRDVVVSHSLEGPIGWTACAQLALALGSSRAAGLWPLTHQTTCGGLVDGGRLVASRAPGLGDPA